MLFDKSSFWSFHYFLLQIQTIGKFLYLSLTWAKTVNFSFATTKANYSMKTLFDMDMGRLTDAGIIQKLFRDITPPKDFKSVAQSQVLDLWHFMSIFLLCGCLMLASILLFIVELLKSPTL
jgi:hypothetical protein